MDDLASKLSELLSNPGTLDKVKSLAGLLGGDQNLSGLLGGDQNLSSLLGGGAAPAQPVQPAPQPVTQSSQDSLLAGADSDMIQTIMKVAPLLSSFRQEDDSTRLLRALRPLLSEERQKKLDEATKILQLMRMLPLLKNSGIF